MRKPAGSFSLIHLYFSSNRHQRELTIIVNPRTRLMRLLKTINLMRRISILPSIAYLVGTWSPEIHPPRHGNSRLRIPRGKFKTGLCPHQWIHILRIILCLQGQETSQYNPPNDTFYQFTYIHHSHSNFNTKCNPVPYPS